MHENQILCILEPRKFVIKMELNFFFEWTEKNSEKFIAYKTLDTEKSLFCSLKGLWKIEKGNGNMSRFDQSDSPKFEVRGPRLDKY